MLLAPLILSIDLQLLGEVHLPLLQVPDDALLLLDCQIEMFQLLLAAFVSLKKFFHLKPQFLTASPFTEKFITNNLLSLHSSIVLKFQSEQRNWNNQNVIIKRLLAVSLLLICCFTPRLDRTMVFGHLGSICSI